MRGIDPKNILPSMKRSSTTSEETLALSPFSRQTKFHGSHFFEPHPFGGWCLPILDWAMWHMSTCPGFISISLTNAASAFCEAPSLLWDPSSPWRPFAHSADGLQIGLPTPL